MEEVEKKTKIKCSHEMGTKDAVASIDVTYGMMECIVRRMG